MNEQANEGIGLMNPEAQMAKQKKEQQKEQQKDAWSNLLLDVILPVVILNQLSKHLGENGPLIALFVALSFPIGHGLWGLFVKKKKNLFSVLGVINILLTGGLALLKLEGQWFAIKEAAIPLILGLAVFYSSFTSKPLVKLLLFNDKVMDIDLVEKRLNEYQTHVEFAKHLKNLTVMLSLSFFLSALLNYILAIRIFTSIPTELSDLQKANLLNEQIAQMTWLGFVVIALPSMFIIMGIFMYMVKGIKKYTGLEMKELIHH